MSIPTMPRFMQSLRVLELAARPLTQALIDAARDLPALRVELMAICPQCHIPLDDEWCASCGLIPEDPPLMINTLALQTPVPDVLWSREEDPPILTLATYVLLSIDHHREPDEIAEAQQFIELLDQRNAVLIQVATTILIHTLPSGRLRPDQISLATLDALTSLPLPTIDRAIAAKNAWLMEEQQLIALNDLILKAR